MSSTTTAIVNLLCDNNIDCRVVKAFNNQFLINMLGDCWDIIIDLNKNIRPIIKIRVNGILVTCMYYIYIQDIHSSNISLRGLQLKTAIEKYGAYRHETKYNLQEPNSIENILKEVKHYLSLDPKERYKFVLK